MKILLCLVYLLSSCKTIYPRISCISFEACAKLCKRKKGVDSMQAKVDLDYMGKVQIAGETCICKDGTATLMAPIEPPP